MCHAISGCAQMTSQNRDPYRESNKHGPFKRCVSIPYSSKCFQRPRSPGSLIFTSNFQEFSSNSLKKIWKLFRNFDFSAEVERVIVVVPDIRQVQIFVKNRDNYFRLPGCCGLVYWKPSPRFEIRICLSSENSFIQDQTFFRIAFANKQQMQIIFWNILW